MTIYDVPGVGRVQVTFDTHTFGNPGRPLKSLNEVVDLAGQDVPYAVWEKVNQYLRGQGLVQ